MKFNQPILSLLLLFLSQSFLHGQENYQIDLLCKHQIKAIEFYNFKILDGKPTSDSIMNVKSVFNSKGYVFNTYIFDSTGFKMRYEKLYQDDTILVATNDFKGIEKRLLGGLVFKYEDGKRISVAHYKDKEKTVETIYSYDKDGLLLKAVRKNPGGIVFKHKFEYNKKDQLIFRGSKKGQGVKLYYDKSDRHIGTNTINKKDGEKNVLTINYNGDSNQKKSVLKSFYRKSKTLGEGGFMDVEAGDFLSIEYYYHETGLIDYTKQYLNGKLDAIKKYKYLK